MQALANEVVLQKVERINGINACAWEASYVSDLATSWTGKVRDKTSQFDSFVQSCCLLRSIPVPPGTPQVHVYACSGWRS